MIGPATTATATTTATKADGVSETDNQQAKLWPKLLLLLLLRPKASRQLKAKAIASKLP